MVEDGGDDDEVPEGPGEGAGASDPDRSADHALGVPDGVPLRYVRGHPFEIPGCNQCIFAILPTRSYISKHSVR